MHGFTIIRVYKSYDPRATILKKVAADVFKIMGRDPIIDIAIELERLALNDEVGFSSPSVLLFQSSFFCSFKKEREKIYINTHTALITAIMFCSWCFCFINFF